MSSRDEQPGFFGGLMQGVTSAVRNRLTVPRPSIAQDREVRDLATVVAHEGPFQTHARARAASEPLPDVARNEVRAMHRYGYGFATGFAGVTASVFAGLGAAQRAVPPRYRAAVAGLRVLTAAASTLNAINAPNELNRQLRAQHPTLHGVASEALHQRAETIRRP
jgi:hypothetical protein